MTVNAKTLGENIAKLRKKNKMTQAELAECLHVSNKAVSKWESGAGYPAIEQLPVLASVFGIMKAARNFGRLIRLIKLILSFPLVYSSGDILLNVDPRLSALIGVLLGGSEQHFQKRPRRN